MAWETLWSLPSSPFYPESPLLLCSSCRVPLSVPWTCCALLCFLDLALLLLCPDGLSLSPLHTHPHSPTPKPCSASLTFTSYTLYDAKYLEGMIAQQSEALLLWHPHTCNCQLDSAASFTVVHVRAEPESWLTAATPVSTQCSAHTEKLLDQWRNQRKQTVDYIKTKAKIFLFCYKSL